MANAPHGCGLSATGGTGQDAATYRSAFLHAWIVWPGGVPEGFAAMLGDLEAECLALPPGLVPTPATELPATVHHFLAGLDFLRETRAGVVDAGPSPAAVGLLAHGGRLWAFRAGLAAEAVARTASSILPRWRLWSGELPIEWAELTTEDAWSLELKGGNEARALHSRPVLRVVPESPTTVGNEEAVAAPDAGTEAVAAPDTAVEAVPDAAVASAGDTTSDSRHARRRRRRRARRAETVAAVATAHEVAAQEVAAQEVAAQEVAAQDASAAASVPSEGDASHPVSAPAIDAAPEPTTASMGGVAEEAPVLPLLWPPAPTFPPRRMPAGPPAMSPRGTRSAPRSRTRDRASWPRWLTRRTTVAVAGAGLVVALVALAVVARRPLATLVEGRFEVVIASEPPGATLRVDGVAVPERTPARLALPPGRHRVELTYGEYGSAAFDVEGERGERVARSATWTGSLGLASADTSVRLTATLDGARLGTLPLWRDDVPVGRHTLAFSGPGVRPWEEEVKIVAGESARVTVHPVRLLGYGVVSARSFRIEAGGREEVDGAAVYVDGIYRGNTPRELKLDPGPHTVRIAAGERSSPVQLFDVQGGARYFATAEFGRAPEPTVAFTPPVRVSLAAPPVLHVRLAADVPLPVREMWLWRRAANGEYERFRLELGGAGGRGQGSLRFPIQGLRPGRLAAYYLAVKTREGEEFYSEVQSVPVVP